MTTNDSDHRTAATEKEQDEKAVQSVPLDTEDGGTAVLEQQNMGGSQQVGDGEYKNIDGRKTVEDAAAEQTQLERDAPIQDHQTEDRAEHAVPESPGYSALGLRPGDPVEPNEPA